MMREVEEEEYEHRMKKTKLMSLEMRRLRSDLIEVYNFITRLKLNSVSDSDTVTESHRHNTLTQ